MTKDQAIKRLKDGAPFSALYVEEWENALSMAIEALKERKTGKWLDRTVCSNCNWYATNRYGLAVDSYFPYCPNCGAKMEVDE